MKETLHIYTRVSTSHQEEEGTSLDSQKSTGIERAKTLGYDHQLWEEGGKSSSHEDFTNRPVLTELLTQIDDGQVKDLFVWNEDRLSRNTITFQIIRKKLADNNVTLHTPSGTKNLSSLQDNLMVGILGEIAQYENQLRKERFRLGKLNRVREGGWLGGPPPYGYSLSDSKLKVEEMEKHWVNFIYTHYKDGESIDEIRTRLMENGVQTRRGNLQWSHGSIEKLLQNSHYSGYWTYHDKTSDEIIKVPCPRLLPAKLVNDVKKVRAKRSYKRGGTRTKTSTQKYTYLLTGLLECGNCGSKYGGNHKVKQTSYYSCNSKSNRYRTKNTDRIIHCSAPTNIRIDRTDQIVWDSVVDVLSRSHLFKETVKTEALKPLTEQSPRDTVKQARKQKENIQKELDKITNAIIKMETDHLIGSRSAKEVEAIIKNLETLRSEKEAEIETLEIETASETEENRWIDWVGAFKDRIDDLKNDQSFSSIEEKKQFLEGVVQKVVVTSNKDRTHRLEIQFRLPYVGDSLVWNDHGKKSKGYSIKNGKKVHTATVDLLKKT